MKTWQKIVISTLVTLAIGAIYLFSVWKHRQDPGVIGRQDASQPGEYGRRGPGALAFPSAL